MKLLLSTALLGLALPAHAHEVWVNAPAHLPAGAVLHADLAYNHDFPNPETIAADREHIFLPLQLTGAHSSRKLTQHGENYHYTSAKPLAQGTYWVSATYRPTFWSKNDKGWQQGSLTDVAGAHYCERSEMFGKSLLVAGGGKADMAVASRAIGQTLEIVPLADPNQAATGALFPLQVLYQGKPLAGATVTATADTVVEKDLAATHDHREPQAFSAKTDKAGKVNLIPLIEGLWKVKIVHKTPFADSAVCQHSVSYATLIVPVGTQRR
ncbi:DUF4198 domain-containing protein [Uruburuella testudinis]|uniref:DUF4198 domain-containing protein n=1 Tax=Uruburuella testudinis TaxID=1282863 RepID=A0ABY4DPS5_9NEIS|nr:DUF4198 domain-containing protein [Uruburuella testudinis]UOO81049.1 DUF4198 domain-containing protein [Uruburuella testudinis]